ATVACASPLEPGGESESRRLDLDLRIRRNRTDGEKAGQCGPDFGLPDSPTVGPADDDAGVRQRVAVDVADEADRVDRVVSLPVHAAPLGRERGGRFDGEDRRRRL